MEVNVISPSKQVISSSTITVVTVPTTVGIVQIMEDHTGLISEIAAGEISVQEADNSVRKFFVSGGYLHVDSNKVMVLVDDVEETK